MPKVSIILTTHGEAIYLKQAIGSVLAQTFEDWELIIAKDGNIQSIPVGDSRTIGFSYQVPNSVKCRFAYTINQAAKFAHGDFITYLCHDDLYLPWRLAWMVDWMEREDWDVAFGLQRLIDETPHGMIIDEIRKGNPDQPAGTLDHSSVMHRRECFDAAGGWNEDCPPRYGDAYFWLRLQQAGFKFHCIPEVLDAHRFNPHSISWKEDHPEEAK